MPYPLTPRIVVRNAADAIAWYLDAFDGEEIERYTLPDGSLAHAAIEVHGAVLAFAEAAPQWHNHDPLSLGGSPVILSLEVEDPDAVFEKALAHGAKAIFPLADQPYGHRSGRVQDPHGHVWIIFADVEQLSPDAVQKRMAAYAE